jgi:DNA-binding NarL/FixJ family response regulator
MNAKKINIAIVDDSKLSLIGWEESFKSCEDIEIVGTALYKKAFRKLCETNKKALDVLIMDKNIDGKTQFDDFGFIEEIRTTYPDKKIIVYTWDYHVSHIDFLKRKKVNGYLPYKSDPEMMYKAIQSVMKGQSFFLNSLETAQADKSAYDRGHEFDVDFIRLVSNLSPAENKVAALLAHDLQTRQIADKLYLSVKSVEKHISSIYLNLNISPKQVHARSEFNRYYGSYFRGKYSGLL